MYIKDYDGWNDQKKQLDQKNIARASHGEIWTCKMGVNVGSEVDGKFQFYRPVLIISVIGSMYFVAPMTTKGSETRYFHTIISIPFTDNDGNTIMSRVMLGQCKIIDPRRLKRCKGKIDNEELNIIKKQLQELYVPIFKDISPHEGGLEASPKDANVSL